MTITSASKQPSRKLHLPKKLEKNYSQHRSYNLVTKHLKSLSLTIVNSSPMMRSLSCMYCWLKKTSKSKSTSSPLKRSSRTKKSFFQT